MNQELHGKQIAQILLDDLDGSGVSSAKGTTLEMSCTFHGDHDEHWVIQKHDGKEIARHNCRAIKSIYWAT